MEISIPKEMSITSFRTSKEPVSGQEFDEITFSGKDEGAPVFIRVRSTTTYEFVDDFDWKLLEGGGDPILTGSCTLAGDVVRYFDYSKPFSAQRAIYTSEEFQISVFGKQALELLTEIVVASRKW